MVKSEGDTKAYRRRHYLENRPIGHCNRRRIVAAGRTLPNTGDAVRPKPCRPEVDVAYLGREGEWALVAVHGPPDPTDQTECQLRKANPRQDSAPRRVQPESVLAGGEPQRRVMVLHDCLRKHVEACFCRRICQPHVRAHGPSTARLLFAPDERRSKLKRVKRPEPILPGQRFRNLSHRIAR